LNTLSTAVFISCAILIFNFQRTPETLSLICCTLIFIFRNFIVSLFFSYLGPPGVFKLGVWDENLVLHPKLNAQLFIDIHRDLCREGAAPTRFYFVTGSSCYLLLRLFFHMQMHRLFQVHLIFIDIYRHLCLCASFLVRNAGGGAAPSPLHPLHPLFMVQKVISNTKWFPRTYSYLPYIHACNVFPNH
jgi:hypothetical protein